jgi:hypothetical protein
MFTTDNLIYAITNELHDKYMQFICNYKTVEKGLVELFLHYIVMTFATFGLYSPHI